ncbi:DUF3040 domain-containing protein [Streptomonospora nanhaiensis]|uniref:DUF3040 domain-containing protein n=1 Tax=Streptomonospora nanhaiensis TaxID=1323731 RepID=A0A853BGZ2_9ACTN|nr:DUF3040 domain-containing protein [Streptomonospora nanhaiensis]MBV2364378.1 DUF3040 domain-containing protein [Streptomonospora nanhaiensis]MBX9390493.1 DUF3040 domain-containing protein [Streptomonospora nanhaiensis]NYI94005.1 hypothetical protein [Streptomonospora nanhaiensis]
MSLRENERRILAEIEQRLGEEDPRLARHLADFGGADQDGEPGFSGTKAFAWLVCGLIALVLFAMLTALYFSAPAPARTPPPSGQQQSAPQEVPAGTP